MRRGLTYLLLPALAVWAGLALACEPPLDGPNWRDAPVKVERECSFSEAGNASWSDITASKAQDIGNGRLGQVVSEDAGCGYVLQTLMVVDCVSGEAIMIDAPSREDPDSIAGKNRVIENLYRPKGKLRLTSKSDIAKLQRQAERYGYNHTTDVIGRINQLKKHNRYNPFCGCAIFYPDSDGAAQAMPGPEEKG